MWRWLSQIALILQQRRLGGRKDRSCRGCLPVLVWFPDLLLSLRLRPLYFFRPGPTASIIQRPYTWAYACPHTCTHPRTHEGERRSTTVKVRLAWRWQLSLASEIGSPFKGDTLTQARTSADTLETWITKVTLMQTSPFSSHSLSLHTWRLTPSGFWVLLRGPGARQQRLRLQPARRPRVQHGPVRAEVSRGRSSCSQRKDDGMDTQMGNAEAQRLFSQGLERVTPPNTEV